MDAKTENTYDLSIIVPVYNTEKYIPDCVDSIINQINAEKLNYELILVDDGSNDGSGIICDRYSEKFIFVKTIHRVNGGLGSARNEGFQKAKGKYIWFVDSDDYIDEKAISIILEHMKKKELDILSFSAQSFSDDGSPILTTYIRKNYLYEIKSGADIITLTWPIKEYLTPVFLKVYKRDFLCGFETLFPESIMHEDEAFSFDTMMKAKRAELIPDILYYRRYRIGSIMINEITDYNASFESFFSGFSFAYRKMIEEYKRGAEMPENWRKLYLKKAESYIYSIINRYRLLNTGKASAVKKKIIEFLKCLYVDRNASKKIKILKTFPKQYLILSSKELKLVRKIKAYGRKRSR